MRRRSSAEAPVLDRVLPLGEGRRERGPVAATVVSRMERRTKTGNKMGIIGLSDPSGHYEAILFSEGFSNIATSSSRARRCCCF